MGYMVDVLPFRVPVSFPMVRALFDDLIGKRQNIVAVTVEGHKHVPHVRKTIPFGQYVVQLEYCMLLAERIETRDFVLGLLVVLLCSGDSRTAE